MAKTISTREETNSAIGSWSGYVYQGLCGLLAVLRMLKSDREGYKDYALQLDAYEDFSIFDDKGKIYSLHQCKSDKNRTNYDGEFAKMKEKVDRLAAEGKLQDAANRKCYFHCNRQVTIATGYGVEAYSFESGKTYCEPGDIQDLLDKEVEALKNAESNTQAVRAALETIVNGDVLQTQQDFFNAPTGAKLYEISRTKRIPFSLFEEKLRATILSYAEGDFIMQMKKAYILGVEDLSAEGDDDENKEKSALFVQRLRELNDNEMKQFLQRVNPKDKLEDNLQSWHNITAGERINYLYNLVTEFPLDMEELHWQTTNSLQTPSTLGNDVRKIEKVSKMIYENQANLDLPWVYDWIVGHVDAHVDNIEESAHIINKTETDIQPTNIFHIKKVGILTIQEKRDGEFD